MGNAWKFTEKHNNARIEFNMLQKDGKTIYYVRDNGVGFNQKRAEKLFMPFHRLHSDEHYEGTGLGLAIVERIIHRHGGKIWAKGAPNEGAVFYFTLQVIMESEYLRQIPVILVSSSSIDTDIDAALQGGASEFLHKDIDIYRFSDSLQKLLRKYQVGDQYLS